MKLKPHPLAEALPRVGGPQFNEIMKSIDTIGQLEPIVLLDDYILDGLTRYEVCQKLKIEPRTKQYRGKRDIESLIDFVKAANFHRRHLGPGHRSVSEVKFERYRATVSREGANLRSNKELADSAGVSERTMDMTKSIVANGSPALVDAVESDEVAISDAAAITTLPKADQTAAVKKVRRGEAKTLREAAEEDKPEIDPDSLEGVQADLRGLEQQLRGLARRTREILRCEGNEITRPFCGCYSVLTLVQPLNHIARTIANDLPVGGTPKKPKLYHEEKAESAAK